MVLDVNSSINSADNIEGKKTYLISNFPGRTVLYCRRTEERSKFYPEVCSLLSFWHKLH